MKTGRSSADHVSFHEVLRPPWWIWVVAALLAALLALELAIATSTGAGLIAMAVLGVVVGVGLESWALSVVVADDTLVAGRARIPVRLLGASTVHNAQRLRLRRGRDADPAAYLALRPWASAAVEVAVCDDADPTPYWLVASRRPTELVAALRTSSGSGAAPLR